MDFIRFLIELQAFGMFVACLVLGYKAGCEIAAAKAANPRQQLMIGIDGYATFWRCLVWPAFFTMLVIETFVLPRMIKEIANNSGEAILKRPSVRGN